MANKERELINLALLAGSKKGRMFRANSGKALQGKSIQLPQHILKMISSWLASQKIKHKEIKVLIDTRIFHGMPKGTPDTIGWESVEICEIITKQCIDHPCKYYKNKINDKNQCVLCVCHKKIAIFKAIECKTGKQQLTEEQENFRDILEKQGGIYEIKRD